MASGFLGSSYCRGLGYECSRNLDLPHQRSGRGGRGHESGAGPRLGLCTRLQAPLAGAFEEVSPSAALIGLTLDARIGPTEIIRSVDGSDCLTLD